MNDIQNRQGDGENVTHTRRKRSGWVILLGVFGIVTSSVSLVIGIIWSWYSVTKGFPTEGLKAYDVINFAGPALSAGTVIASVGILFRRIWAMKLVYWVLGLSIIRAFLLFGVFGGHHAIEWFAYLYAAILIFHSERAREHFGLPAKGAGDTTQEFAKYTLRFVVIIFFILCVVLDPTEVGRNRNTWFRMATEQAFGISPDGSMIAARIINQYTLVCLLLWVVSCFFRSKGKPTPPPSEDIEEVPGGWYFRDEREALHGPVSVDSLREIYRKGEIQDSTTVWTKKGSATYLKNSSVYPQVSGNMEPE